MPCNLASETLTALHEKALPLTHTWRLRAHVRRCPTCRQQLAALALLDTQLRHLAALPVEPIVSRRPLLLVPLVALSVLGLGTWRVFTPELRWSDVEKAMATAKTISGQKTVIEYSYPVAPPTNTLDKVLALTESTTWQAPEEHPFQTEFVATPEGLFLSQRERFVGLSSLGSPQPFTLAIPDAYRAQVRFWQGKRVIAFVAPNIVAALPEPNPKETVTDEILVDPRTARLLQRTRTRYLTNGRLRCQERLGKFIYDKPHLEVKDWELWLGGDALTRLELRAQASAERFFTERGVQWVGFSRGSLSGEMLVNKVKWSTLKVTSTRLLKGKPIPDNMPPILLLTVQQSYCDKHGKSYDAEAQFWFRRSDLLLLAEEIPFPKNT